MKYPLHSRQNVMLPATIILLILLGWYFVIQQSQALTQATIAAYQQTELEIVQVMARSVEHHVDDQVKIHGYSDTPELEQEIFERFIAPVRLLENGDAWIYAPDHVVFDRSSDFPAAYRGKSMAEIFEMQVEAGASHYEEMTEAVMNAREGIGWYIWLPEKGKEIAAWTPVLADEFVWTIGLSTPLPEILKSTGATAQIRTSIAIMTLATIISLILLIGWASSAAQRSQAEKALHDSEQRFRQVIASISDHVYTIQLTTAGKQINHYVSPNVEALTGYPQEKFTDDWRFWQSLIHPEDRAEAAAQVERFIKGQHSEVEYRLIRANGNAIWVLDNGQVEKDEARQIITIYGVVSDITERKRDQEELALARDQALEANRLKSELLANVSHDLRTPLSTIIGFSELLELGVPGILSDKQREIISGIIDNAQYLIRMINELLDQAKLEAGRLRLNITSFNPADIVEQVFANMRVPAQSKGLTLTTKITSNVPATVSGDPDRVQQILFNLVNNAIKFTEEGQVNVRLYRPDETHWALKVSDTGPGIPVEAQAYIFDAFRQVDGSVTRKHSGSGLGLSIVNQLVTLMGGQITLESKVGQGSTFTILLPLVSIPAESLLHKDPEPEVLSNQDSSEALPDKGVQIAR